MSRRKGPPDPVLASAHKQMGAIVAKLFDELESLEYIRTLHPLEFDYVRKRMIAALWDAYNVGLRVIPR